MLQRIGVVRVARPAHPQRVLVQLNALAVDVAEHHRTEAAVAERQRLVPFARRMRIKEDVRPRAAGRAASGASATSRKRSERLPTRVEHGWMVDLDSAARKVTLVPATEGFSRPLCWRQVLKDRCKRSILNLQRSSSPTATDSARIVIAALGAIAAFSAPCPRCTAGHHREGWRPHHRRRRCAGRDRAAPAGDRPRDLQPGTAAADRAGRLSSEPGEFPDGEVDWAFNFYRCRRRLAAWRTLGRIDDVVAVRRHASPLPRGLGLETPQGLVQLLPSRPTLPPASAAIGARGLVVPRIVGGSGRQGLSFSGSRKRSSYRITPAAKRPGRTVSTLMGDVEVPLAARRAAAALGPEELRTEWRPAKNPRRRADLS